MIDKLIGGTAIKGIEAVGNIIDQLYTSDDEKLEKEIAKQRLFQKASLAQTEINKIEAQHRTIFVAGWRPFIGWVCGLALAWHFMIYDFLAFLMPDRNLPELAGTGELISIVLALLGLGGLRTAEKFKGKAK